jgi:hypothetical protein
MMVQLTAFKGGLEPHLDRAERHTCNYLAVKPINGHRFETTSPSAGTHDIMTFLV